MQVLNEFTAVSRRKQRPGLAVMTRARRSRAVLEMVIAAATHEHSHFRRERSPHDHGLSFYDALIVAAAIEAGCDTLYSEDLQHGRTIAGLAIVNPFRETAR